MADPREPSGTTAGSQTLSRGLRALELLAEAERPITIAELAAGLGVHRSNAYRLLRTLEDHRFVIRDDAGRIRLGPKLTVLAHGVSTALHTAAMPAVTTLAYELGMTVFLTLLDTDEIVTLATVEPSNVAATVSRNPGVRHTVHRGAPGHAIEASLSAVERERLLGSAEFGAPALECKQLGYSVSRSEVIPGVTSVAVPLRITGEPPAALAVVHFSLPDPLDDVIAALHRAAARIARSYQ